MVEFHRQRVWQATVYGVSKSWTWLLLTHTHTPTVRGTPTRLPFQSPWQPIWAHLVSWVLRVCQPWDLWVREDCAAVISGSRAFRGQFTAAAPGAPGLLASWSHCLGSWMTRECGFRALIHHSFQRALKLGEPPVRSDFHFLKLQPNL